MGRPVGLALKKSSELQNVQIFGVEETVICIAKTMPHGRITSQGDMERCSKGVTPINRNNFQYMIEQEVKIHLGGRRKADTKENLKTMMLLRRGGGIQIVIIFFRGNVDTIFMRRRRRWKFRTMRCIVVWIGIRGLRRIVFQRADRRSVRTIIKRRSLLFGRRFLEGRKTRPWISESESSPWSGSREEVLGLIVSPVVGFEERERERPEPVGAAC